MKDLNLIYFAAQELPPADRPAYLTKACEGDPVLRTRVEQMLAIASQAESFFAGDLPGGASKDCKPERGPANTIKLEFATVPDEVIGQKIGRYKILERIGEGGCGVVYVAEQTEPVRRRVALKVIKLGMDTKQVVARFEAERQALAMMDHPNIAKVLDGGATDNGRPYFIMELVRGIKITDYCDQASLPTKDRLNLFIQVCHAIQHAHQKGIIHRDIKPSNILVTLNDGVPVPKVIDFGIAKATEGRLTDATVYTQLNQFIGTPAYMSPEQAEMSSLDIDTRSDIYSLGILLYELLAGSTPFDTQELMSMGIDKMRKTIREKEPVRPSTRLATLHGDELSTAAKRRAVEAPKLIHLLKGDLDWIVMKCLEKDRTRRYDTANGLAADLQRHLNDEPVAARPPSTAYKFQKAFRRNKLVFTAGGAIAAALVLGITASVWQAVRAQHESARAKSAEQRALAALDELRATAPAFAEQARALAAKERYDEAIEKLDYALKLRPDAAEFLVAKADLLQCQLKLAEAAAIYRAALRVQPGLARAEASAKLCDELLAAKPDANGKLTRESLAKLQLAMLQEQRPPAELMPVGRLLGQEKKFLLDYWLTRLKDLPISPEKPLKDRLTVREDGRLALDLSDTKISDLSPLAGAPLAALDVSKSTELTDLSPLRGVDLVELNLSATSVEDLTPLREMHSLEKLNLSGDIVTDLTALSGLRLDELDLTSTRTYDISALRGMKLKKLKLRETRVADLSPLAGMPLTFFDASDIPATDYSPLAGAPLDTCMIQNSPLRDLSFLQNSPVKELTLYNDNEARGYAVLAGLKSLNLLVLPQSFRSLSDEEQAAIGALRTNSTLRNIDTAERREGSWMINTAQSKDDFWRDWDREQSMVAPLRKSGIRFSFAKLPSGTYSLTLQDQPLRDLSPLKGMPISELNIWGCLVSDLTPIHDLKLEHFDFSSASVTDLSPLHGMPLKWLRFGGPKVTDISPLKGLPLQELYLEECNNLTDISALAEISTLEKLTVPLQAGNIEALHKLTKLQMLGFHRATQDGPPDSSVEDFWKDYSANGWLSRLRDSGIKPTALTRLVDGTWEVNVENTPISDLKIFSGAKISRLNLGKTGVTDLAPLRGMALKELYLYNTRVADLSPLKGMPIEILNLFGTEVSDLSALRGMPLISLRLHNCAKLTDLSPLAGDTTLQETTLPDNATNFECLRGFPKLQRLSYVENTSSWVPDETAAEFWNHYTWITRLHDSGIKANSLQRRNDGTWYVDLDNSALRDLTILSNANISSLSINETAIADLKPLRGMPLKQLWLFNTKVTDLSPLQGMPIEILNFGGTKVTDLSALHGMPLVELSLFTCTEAIDFSPLAGVTTLKRVTLPKQARNFDFLREVTGLEWISYAVDSMNGYRPDKTAAEFWADYDAKKQAESKRP